MVGLLMGKEGHMKLHMIGGDDASGSYTIFLLLELDKGRRVFLDRWIHTRFVLPFYVLPEVLHSHVPFFFFEMYSQHLRYYLLSNLFLESKLLFG